jgi:hypothetical protein
VGFKKSPPAYLSLTTPGRDGELRRGLVGANYASSGSGILDFIVSNSVHRIRTAGISVLLLAEQINSARFMQFLKILNHIKDVGHTILKFETQSKI